ncbi:uncharacterized protein EV422DRAFT_619118 [Fimicolochytrium jonesii]|uniref:uncharacterized protein n=1 Tax=Fimicolochytrium jonesii TaxID=1396493 RepID=UPI0022FDF2E2|nr:uncharacterized protein EV422DRAFT_619118 [Fimicolochytrium jonesii]KAI8822676.1 hypothetical protein EV422DRAFT_619118 [Fimicolochytrium jonesii]
MSVVKRLLKSAREAITKENYADAKDYCVDILDSEPENYHALVFLALAEQHLGNTQDAEKAYTKAIKLAPENPLALQGLANLYTETKDDEKLVGAWNQLRALFRENKDEKKALDITNKLVDLHIRTNNKAQAASVLKDLTPCGAFHDNTQDNLAVWTRIADLQQQHFDETYTKEVELRRRRLDADPVDVVRSKVEKEVLMASELDETYASILEITKERADAGSSQVYTDIGSRYVEYLNRKIPHVADEDKLKMYMSAVSLAKELATRKATSALVGEIILDSQDVAINEYPIEIMDMVATLPSSDLAPIATAYLRWRKDHDPSGALEEIQSLPNRTAPFFTQRLLGELHLELHQHGSAHDHLIEATAIDKAFVDRTGYDRPTLQQSLRLSLATAYEHLGAKYLPQALALYKVALQQQSDSVPALLGLGAVLAAMNKYEESTRCYEKVLQVAPDVHAATAGLGWVTYLKGDTSKAAELLEQALQGKEDALTLFRLGCVYWAMGDTYRADETRCFTPWLHSAKLDPTHAPTFSHLGHYYHQIAHDKRRALRCYSRALQIDPGEPTAVRALSRIYILDNDVISAQAILNAYLHRHPRCAWAHKQSGFLSLSRGDHVTAITHFQSALRVDAKDVRCWEGLGEAYATDGKFVAGLKALKRAIELEPEQQSASLHYQVAGIYQRLGMYTDAVDAYRAALSLAETNTDERGGSKLHVPTVNGLAETLVAEARRAFEEGGDGRCAELLGEAFGMISGALERTRMHAFAKMLGDVCLAFVEMVPAYAERGEVRAVVGRAVGVVRGVVGGKTGSRVENVQVPPGSEGLNTILECGTAAFELALHLCARQQHKPDQDENLATVIAGHWHDLGLTYFHRSHLTSTPASKIPLLNHAIAAAKMALKHHPLHDIYWSTLSIYTSHTHPKLAQHSLIKALTLTPTSSASLWSNLGIFYLLHNNTGLAQEAFSKALFVDPECARAWLGQGVVAERGGRREAAWESLEQGYGLVGSGGVEVGFVYAAAAVQRIGKGGGGGGETVRCLERFVRQRPRDWVALNLLGVVLEREGWYERAVGAYEGARKALAATTGLGEEERKRFWAQITENIARVRCASRDFDTSLTEFATLTQSTHAGGDAYTAVTHALALTFSDALPEGLAQFEKALDLASDDTNPDLHNYVTFILSRVLYALGTDQHRSLATQQLLACLARSPGHVRALSTLCALSLVQGDVQLAQSAAVELINISEPEKLGAADTDVDVVLSALFACLGNRKAARGFLSKSVRRRPWVAGRWRVLADHVGRSNPTAACGRVAAAATVVGGGDGDGDVLGVETVGVVDLALGKREAGRTLMKAVRARPGVARTWVALGMGLRGEVARGVDQSRMGPLSNAIEKTAHAAITLSARTDTTSSAHAARRTLLIAGWARLLIADVTTLPSTPMDLPTLQLTDALISEVLQLNDANLQAVAYKILGRALWKAGDVGAAATAWKRAVGLGRGYEELASLYTRLALYPAATRVFHTALSDSKLTPLQRTNILTRLATLHLLTANSADAAEAVNEALKGQPGHVAARCVQAVVYVRSGERGKAGKCLRGVDLEGEVGARVREMVEGGLDV